MNNQVLVIGCSQAGLQAAQDLANVGLQVNLVESSPFLASDDSYNLPEYLKNTLLLEILKDPRIKIWTNTEIQEINQRNGEYQVTLQQNPRYIDLAKCTACGDCVEVCPITVPGTKYRAIHFGGQPDCAVIEKWGISPCSDACPAGIHVQGYVALIGQGSYKKAYDLIQEALPFPSVCGRVCNHICESACSRSQLDEAVNLMALKRFVSDWSFEHKNGDELPIENYSEIIQTGKRVAVIGAGPTGLTAARDLNRVGHEVKVFDANPEPGGMMRVGIPPHRLDYDQLAWEIDQILSEGIELQLNTWVDDIPSLFLDGFDAVLVAAGAVRALKPLLENTDHPDNWLSLDFLKRVSLDEKIDLSGREVIVLGGGDVAMDAARAALRLGNPKVKIVCRGLRASDHELRAAEEERIEIIRGRVFQKVELSGKKISGVNCLEAEVGDVVDGKRQFTELPGTEHLIPGDLVIWALGQEPDSSFMPEDEDLFEEESGVIKTDQRGRTFQEGLFAAGDYRLGNTTFVVDAVGEGHLAAKSVHQFLMDLPDDKVDPVRQVVLLSPEEMRSRLEERKKARSERQIIPCLPIEDRVCNFSEVDLTLTENDVLMESGRCLVCGPCSECMACVEVCKPGAINLDQFSSSRTVEVKAVLSDQIAELAEEPDSLIRYSSSDPMAGSAAAYEVIKDLEELPAIIGVGTNPISRNGVKTGLILCQCGGEISNVVNTAALCKQALDWPEIDFTSELAYSCTAEAGGELKRIIKEQQLGKLILAACSCCSLDQVCYSCTFQRLRCKDNLGIFNSLKPLAELEFINIREQCAWVHRRSKKKATDAARTLIRTTLARKPVSPGGTPDKPRSPQKALVVGKGDSVGACLEGLAELGLAAETMEVLSGDVIRSGAKYRVKGMDGEIQADYLIVAPGSGAELDHLSGFLKLNNQNTLVSRERLEMNTLDFGMVLCPPGLDPEISGKAAAARIFAWLNRIYSQDHPRAAEVDWKRCRACGTCQDVCGFGIPEIIEDDLGTYAVINPFLCQDCGICTAHCPSGAITPATHTRSELNELLEMILD